MTSTASSRADVAKAVGRLLASPDGRHFLDCNGYRPGVPMVMVAPDEPLSVLSEWAEGQEDQVLIATLVSDKPVILQIDPDDGSGTSVLDDLQSPGLDRESPVGLFAEYLQERAQSERRRSFNVRINDASSHSRDAATTRVHAMA